MRIDVHNHFYPRAYLDEVARLGGVVRLEKEKDGRQVFTIRGVPVVHISPPQLDPKLRIKDMDACGVDMQMLSLTMPHVYLWEPEAGLALSQAVNDSFAEIISRYPERFTAACVVPLQDPRLAVQELERAVGKLGLRAVYLITSIDGKGIHGRELWPFYERVAELEVPLFIHPFLPPGAGEMRDFWLQTVLGVLFESALTAARFAFSGLLEAVPGLRVVVPHIGGLIPYSMGRLDKGFRTHPPCSEHIDRPPSEYLAGIYIDSVAFERDALGFAVGRWGAERVMLGSDYPQAMGDLGGCVADVEALEIPEEDKEKIRSGTAQRLLGLTSWP
ncbi:amidohydrolase family protein [Nitrospinota bacterium]